MLLLSIPSLTGNPNVTNPLPIEAVALERARILSLTAERQSDSLLLPLLEYERLVEDVRAAYRSHPTGSSGTNLSAIVQEMTVRLDTWRSSVPSDLWCQGMQFLRAQTAQTLTGLRPLHEQIPLRESQNPRDGITVPVRAEKPHDYGVLPGA